MKLDQLRYFVETAKRQHITGAAHFLHISPSAVSHSLKDLEDELGVALFIKNGRQIKLTAHGKILMQRAENLLAEAENIRTDLCNEQKILTGHYRLAATHMLSAEFLTPAWIEIQQNNPNLTATLHSFRSVEVLNKVNSNELDLGFCFNPHSMPNHEQEIIHVGKLVFCFGKKHPFLKKRQVQDLEIYPAIAALSAQGIDNCEKHPGFQKLKIKPKVTNLFDSYDVAIKALKTNTFWTLLPDFLAHNYRDDLACYQPKRWQAEYFIAAIWPKNNLRTRGLNIVIDKIKQLLKSQ